MTVSAQPAIDPQRHSFARMPDILSVPNLLQIQRDSFAWFTSIGLHETFAEISPIDDFTGKKLALEFIVPSEPFGKPKLREDECRSRAATYAAPLTILARLTNKESGEIIEKDVFM